MLNLITGTKWKIATGISVLTLVAVGSFSIAESVSLAVKNHEIKTLVSQLKVSDEALTAQTVNIATCRAGLADQNKTVSEMSTENEKLKKQVTAAYDSGRALAQEAQTKARTLLAPALTGDSCQQMQDADSLIQGMLK